VNAYTYAQLQDDLAHLESQVRQIQTDVPDDARMHAFALMSDAVQERAQSAGLGHDAFIAINAMLIRHGLLDTAYRIT